MDFTNCIEKILIYCLTCEIDYRYSTMHDKHAEVKTIKEIIEIYNERMKNVYKTNKFFINYNKEHCFSEDEFFDIQVE